VWIVTPLVIVAIGSMALVADLTGRFVVSPQRLRWFQWIAVAAAAGPGLAPLVGYLTGRLLASDPFILVALAFLVAFVTFAIGVLRWRPEPGAVFLRRAGYVGLLLLAAIPSLLILLAPAVWLSGIGLARAREVAGPGGGQV
jgi:hypothetical protein